MYYIYIISPKGKQGRIWEDSTPSAKEKENLDFSKKYPSSDSIVKFFIFLVKFFLRIVLKHLLQLEKLMLMIGLMCQMRRLKIAKDFSHF